MQSNLSIADAVVKAIKKIKPNQVRKDGTLKVSQSTLIELQLRVKNML
jgi:hypothetical protein